MLGNTVVKLGEGTVLIGNYDCEDGRKGILLRDTGKSREIGSKMGENESFDSSMLPGDVDIVCSNVESARVLLETVQLMVDSFDD